MQAVSLLILIALAAVFILVLLAVKSRIDSLERSQERIDRSVR
jgi:O-antigen ligase